MKFFRSHEPVRWRDRAADEHSLESRAAMLADAAAGQEQPLAPRAAARIREEIVARRSRRPGSRIFAFQRLPVQARVAFGIVLVILCATTAGGARLLWQRYVSAPRTIIRPPAESVPRPPPAPVRHPLAQTAPLTAPPAPAGDPVGTASNAPLPASARARVAHPSSVPAIEAPAPVVDPPAAAPPPAPPPAAAPPAAAAEAALVAEALRDLRQRNDARAALATLDRHAREFPHGVLETEAFRTRIEAVIQLGDLKTALGLLDGKLASTQALGANLTLTRAELRAAAGRFGEALPDFNQVLEGAAGPLAAGGDERALYGRAVCLARLGQDERAGADLLAYQTRFPEGRFAREVQRLLAGKEPPSRP
jgi:hypothetical protein